ncbi:14618_t:CDS:2 [Ambispora leptoticha]|uniref:14618_t:CDS:1 n=1 Tax=Ambispora leptoticha TaxID=144679 RepID=A0A9N9G5V0_9GLOM|nr:14618_t:CDS:2 [Ambispora leptoticha]
MAINISQQHFLNYSGFAYGDETYYNENYLPFVEFQMTNQQKVCSLLTTTKERFSSASPNIDTKITVAKNDNHMTNDKEAPSQIISSLLNYIANEFDQDLDRGSCESPGLSSSSSNSGPQTPVNQTITERRNRLFKDGGLFVPFSSTPAMTSTTTDIEKTELILKTVIRERTGYFDGWDGEIIEEPPSSIFGDDSDTANTDTVSLPLLGSDNHKGALLNDDIGLFEDSNSSNNINNRITSTATNLSVLNADFEKGFFKTIFRSGKLISQNTYENKNGQRNFNNTTELTPQQQYQLNMRRHLEQALHVARKKSVSATFRREVCRVIEK